MKISQREARRLRKRVEALEESITSQRRAWSREWPGGTHIVSVSVGAGVASSAIHTARLLGHAVVVTEDNGELRFYALPLPKAVA